MNNLAGVVINKRSFLPKYGQVSSKNKGREDGNVDNIRDEVIWFYQNWVDNVNWPP